MLIISRRSLEERILLVKKLPLLFLILTPLPALPAAAASIAVTDDIGREVVLKEPARRIISLAPHITENLFAIGAGDLLVGVVSYSNYPEEARGIEAVGGYNDFSIEKIFALNPDLIIAWSEGNQRMQVEKLIESGFTVYIDEPQRLTDIARSLEHFGLLTGNIDNAKKTSNEFLHELGAFKKRYASREKITVFYQVWNNPLLTVGGDQIIGDVIQLCGGNNVFAGLQSPTPAVSVEAVLQADPQAIIASGMDKARPEWLDDWSRWPFLQAVMNNHLYFIPPDIIQRYTLRLLEGTQRLCGYLEEVRDEQHILK